LKGFTGKFKLANQVKRPGAKRRLIKLSYAGLCIYRITIGRRGFNSVYKRALILGICP